MAKKEVKTDLWVASQLKECGIEYDAQGSNVKKFDVALSLLLPVNASGEPDYAYMGQYAKNMTPRKYKQYPAFLEKHK